MMPAAVFDCMVFVQAPAIAKGPACARHELVRGGRPSLHVSPEILGEVGDVPGRPKVRRKLPTPTDEAAEAFLHDVIGRAERLSEVPATFRLERDPKGERYINLAVASGASHLVRWDRDLLRLMDDEGSCRPSPHHSILEPPALLRLFPQDPTETAPE